MKAVYRKNPAIKRAGSFSGDDGFLDDKSESNSEQGFEDFGNRFLAKSNSDAGKVGKLTNVADLESAKKTSKKKI